VKVSEIQKPSVCIVRVNGRIPMPRDIYFQVTVCPDKISPAGDYIRFGDVRGDEFTGWVPVADVDVVEVIGVFEGESIPYNEMQAYAVQKSAAS
jgi:hypothetical protein